jgi:hypothetical protein
MAAEFFIAFKIPPGMSSIARASKGFHVIEMTKLGRTE